MLSTFDAVVVVVYCVGVAVLGIKMGGKQRSVGDYFMGSRDLPWWAVCFSVVATETSTLTVIGIPAVAYGSTLTFLQLTLGYIVGRIFVAIYFLPRYYSGGLTTAYTYLGKRFGVPMRTTASVTFLVTRLLADGVRLFATAIPLKVVATSVGLDVTYWQIILFVGVITIVYTYIGGIKAVVWMDVVQMFVYVGGAIVAIGLLLAAAPAGWWEAAGEVGKTRIFDFDSFTSMRSLLTSPYSFAAAVIGGAVFSMASHGTDQLIVQRLLTCRSIGDSRRALIGSGIVVAFQFAVFLILGLLLWTFYGGQTPTELGLGRADEVFPFYIVREMPSGIAGLLLAGILAAAMSTLSSSLNALASSTLIDIYRPLFKSTKVRTEEQELLRARRMTLFWGIVFIGFAGLFQDQQNPVVELGLSIASFTYGGLLGAFLLGMLVPYVRQREAIIAFVSAIVFLVFLVSAVYVTEDGTFVVSLTGLPNTLDGNMWSKLAWPWYTAAGSVWTILVGSLISIRHR